MVALILTGLDFILFERVSSELARFKFNERNRHAKRDCSKSNS
jgi:hypothetical protein